MPFTFSHPAIVVLLNKTRFGLSLTGLVVGSMIPDFEFFIRMRTAENIGHHWLGIFIFDVPLALILCFLFHNIVRNLLIENLPTFYSRHFTVFSSFNFNRFAATNKCQLLISIVLGILSHLFWDAFTHYDGMMVQLLPVLSKNIPLFKFAIPVYLVLQIVSSIWGLWAMHNYIKKLPVGTLPKQKSNNAYWHILLYVTAFIFMFRVAILPQYLTFWDVFMSAVGSGFYALIITSIYTQIEWLNSKRNNSCCNKLV
ncbi:MAG: DUF4184 family protein [Pedobacter sp.]|nr:DUF4184 family protein [Chitinophagaceae bacterium]